MAQGSFLYFIPNRSFDTITQEDFKLIPQLTGAFFELIYSPMAFANKLMKTNVMRGPEGNSGCIIAPQPQSPVDQRIGYYPKEQEWRQFGDVWIGWEAELLPGPESLRRAKQYHGKEIQLGDNRVWQLPTFLEIDPESLKWRNYLPCTYGIDSECKYTAKIQERYEPLMATLREIHSAIYGGGKATVEQMFGWSAALLQTNYRLGPIEASLLGIFTDDAMVSILHAGIDDTAFAAAHADQVPALTE